MDKFERAYYSLTEDQKAALIKDAVALGQPEEAVRKIIEDETTKEVYLNDIYQVSLRPVVPPKETGWPEMIWLSIKRRDREPIRDWRDLQEIKNQLVGPENEGFELFPAESRRVDSANQYHMFVFRNPKVWLPFGFVERFVTDKQSLYKSGAKQRKFE